MKLVLSLITTLVFSSAVSANIFDCKQNEAQFIGQIREATIIRIDQGIRDCSYTMRFQVFNPSQICPIDWTLAEESEIIDYNCRFEGKAGDVISGILIEGKDGTFVIE